MSSRAKKDDAASKIEFARSRSFTFFSSSLTRADSAVDVPGCRPASMRACLVQPRKVSGTIPIIGPIRWTAACNDNPWSSAIASVTIRRAR